jgi:hypothetical protein
MRFGRVEVARYYGGEGEGGEEVGEEVVDWCAVWGSKIFITLLRIYRALCSIVDLDRTKEGEM